MTGSGPNKSGAAQANQLRDRIDQGATADKVDHPDPAAAPLGTDAEAGGAPPTRAQVAQAMRDEVAHGAEAAGTEPLEPDLPKSSSAPVLVALVCLGAIAAVAMGLWLI
ncbi:MAG: hypothetical protein VX874_03220 [Pseudomonadota bacterium]|nr:hypothetical protein [Pseudomonadota bacterium]